MTPDSKKLHLAYFSPLKPRQSGIADYSEDLLPYLASLAKVTPIVESCRSGSLPYPPSAITTAEFLDTASSFDVPIYQIGSSVQDHGYMMDCLQHVPGIVVLHDYCLHYLILALTLLRGDLQSLKSALAVIYGSRASSLARRLLFGVQDPFALSFAGQLVLRSRAVVVHSHYAEQLVRKDFPTKRVQMIPMGVPLDLPKESRSELKTKYGFRDEHFIVASINSPAYNKRLSLVLEAVRLVHTQFPQVRLVILSGKHFDRGVKTLLEDPALRAIVTSPGWLSADAYRDFIYMADVVVDMRYPSGAETSASICRAMALGKASVLSAQGSFLDVPDNLCIKIPVGQDEVGRLAGVLKEVATNRATAENMGKEARGYALSNFRLELVAQRYIDLAEEVIFSNLQAGSWAITPKPKPFERLLISTTYKTFRTVDFLRTYGFAETSGRVRKELARRSEARSNGLIRLQSSDDTYH